MVRNNPVTLHDPDGRAPTPSTASTSATTSEHFINRLPTSFHEIKTNDWGESIIKQAETWNQEDSLDFKRETHYAVSELGKHFTLYSTPDHPSKQLIVFAHGGFNSNSGVVPIPNGMTLEFLNPHRTKLMDPGLENIAMDKSLTLFSISNHHLELHNQVAIDEMESLGIRAVTGDSHDTNWKATRNEKKRRFSITNYDIAEIGEDILDEISNALAVNQAIMQTNQKQTVKTDIVTVKSSTRIDGKPSSSATTIGKLFRELKANNIKYDNIVCSFCRGESGNANTVYDPITASLHPLK